MRNMMGERGEPSHISSSNRAVPGPSRRVKRYHDNEDEEELCVDDLAVAAQYAFAVPSFVTPVAPEAPPLFMNNNSSTFVDEDEIDLDEGEEAVTQSPVVETGAVVSNFLKTNDVPPLTVKPNILGPGYDSTDDDDSDEESDIDIREHLARMEGGGEDEDSDDGDDDAPDRPSGVVPRKPMTVNEIDAYQADLQQLQNLLQWNNIATSPANIRSGPPEWRVAGHVQHHVIEERTIVILSLQGGVLLKEGTPLVIRQSVSSSSNVPEHVIQLGNILEIFGPVSQPLYSVRLALPREEASTAAEQKSEVARGSNESDFTSADHAESENATRSAAGKALPSLPILDPWSKGGEYTKILQAHAKLPVYFWHDSSAIMDREAVYRSSVRGCDASNIFDEEVLDVQDYSDDEQERAAKGHRKKGGHGGTQGPMVDPRGHDRQHHSSRAAPVGPGHHSPSGTSSATNTLQQPRGFHSEGQPPLMYRQGLPVGSVPYAFPQQIGGNTMYHPTSNVHNSPQFLQPHGMYAQPPPFFYHNGAYQTIPPPPPPTSNTRTPSNAHTGSTEAVYYDFS